MSKSFIIKNLILAIILAIITYLAKILFLPQLQYWLFGAIVFFYIINLLVAKVGHKTDINPRRSITASTLTIIIRLFSSLIFILIYLVISDIKDVASIIFFLFYYLCFMVFEIYFLVHKLRVQN